MAVYPHAGFFPPLYFPNQLGNPTPGKSVGLYEVGTNTLATLYADRDRAAAAPNPFTLDAGGNSPPAWGEPNEYDARRVVAGVPAATLVRVEIKVDDADAVDEPSAGVPDAGDVGYDVFLLIGQSNMAARGTPYDIVRRDPPDTRIWQYAYSGVYSNTIALAIDPLGSHEIDASLAIGPGIAFARWYLGSIKANRRVLLVPMAHGSTGFTTADPLSWDVTTADDNLVDVAVAQANAALALANADPALSNTSRFCGILWHQGESDTSLTQAQYAAELDALIAYLRANIAGATDAPFVVGQMTDLHIAATGGPVNLAHIDTPRRVVGTGFAGAMPGGAIIADPRHFTADGVRWLGHTYFDGFRRARLNVLATAPVAPADLTLEQAGTSLIVSWQQSFGRVTDYLVEYKLAAAGTWTTLVRAQSLDITATITGLTFGATYNVRVSTINEEGTSDPATDTVTLVSIPTQVQGLAAGTPTLQGVPLTWNATSGADSYLVEYKATASGTWLTYSTVTDIAETVSQAALASSTSYDFRVSAINEGGAGTPSAVVSATSVNSPLPLGPTLWLLADGTFYQDSTRLVSASADLDPVGSWTDFSTFDRHAVQVDSERRPIIRSGLNGLNGGPVVRMDGIDDFLVSAVPASATKTLFVVAQKRTAASTSAVDLAAYGTSAQLYTRTSEGAGFIYGNNSVGSATVVGGTPTDWNIIAITYASLSSAKVRVGGGAGTTLNPDDSYAAAIALVLGAVTTAAVNYGDYDVAEVIEFGSALSLANHDVVGDYLAAKFGLTWTPAA